MYDWGAVFLAGPILTPSDPMELGPEMFDNLVVWIPGERPA